MPAKYNVNAYETGRLEKVDFGVLEDLGDAAMVHVARLTKAKDDEVKQEAKECYRRMKEDSNKKSSMAYFSIPRAIGRKNR